jgi:hypothetical protein
MAFNQDTFAPSGAHSSKAPAVFTYKTSDSTLTVTSAGYFDSKKFQLNEGDSIITSASDGSTVLTVQASTDTAIAETTPIVADSVIIVKTGSQLTGTIDSTKLYFLDGIIDMTGLGTITVPASGISVSGDDFDISQLISSTPGHVLFTTTGSIKLRQCSVSVTGAGASVYSGVGATGGEILELSSVNYNDCTSLGEISGFRQGLELDTGRFGGSPSLTLSGAWDGYRIATSISRSLDNSMSEPLFKNGTALTFSGRFLTNINADLGTLAPFSDFVTGNFLSSSAFIIDEALVRRNGVANAADATINTGIDHTDIACSWSNNIGIPNTFEGGRLDITSASATALNGVSIGVFLDIAGTYAASDLQHFDSPSNGQLRHLGSDPREYSFAGDILLDGTSGDIITVKVSRWDNSAAGFVDLASFTREIVNLPGANDSASFGLLGNTIMDENDYLKLQVSNGTGARDVTAEVDDFLIVSAR